MDRINGAGHVGRRFVTEDADLGRPPTLITDAWLNSVQEEIVNVILAVGGTLDGLQEDQLLQAINDLIQAASNAFVSVGGTADAIMATYAPVIAALTNGMTVYVRAASANATATPTFTPASGVIAAKAIVKGAGAALVAGDVAGDGHWIELQYDQTLDKWVLQNPATGVSITTVPDATTAVKGKVQLATNLEVQAGLDALKAITAAALASSMLGGVGQTPQNLTGSRALGVTYTNSTGRPIFVSISVMQPTNTGTSTLTVGGVVVARFAFASSYAGASDGVLSWVVMPGQSYVVNNLGTLTNWSENR